MIAGVRIKPARADQPGTGAVGVDAQDPLQSGQDAGHVVGGHGRVERAVDMDVSPGPQLRGRRQRSRFGNRDERQRAAHGGAVLELGAVPGTRVLSAGEHDQREPGPQALGGGVWGGRAVSPGEVFVVELDVGEVVGLDVGDPRSRFGARDHPGIHPDDVPGAVDLHGPHDVAADRVR